MSHANKVRIATTLIGIFVAGVIAGGFVVAAFSGHKMPPDLGSMTERQMGRMIQELGLSTEQIARIEPIVEEISVTVHSVRRESMQRFSLIYDEMTKRVLAELTPEQRAIFTARQEARRVRIENRLKERRGPGGPLRGEHGPRYGPHHDGPPPPEPPPADPVVD